MPRPSPRRRIVEGGEKRWKAIVVEVDWRLVCEVVDELSTGV
jgi:hypothetical protein